MASLYTTYDTCYRDFLSHYSFVISDIILRNWNVQDDNRIAVDDWIVHTFSNQPYKKNICLALWDSSYVVGICIWNTSEIYSLHVRKEYQNKGVGSLLLRDKLYENQKVRVLVDNTEAIRFYRRHGFDMHRPHPIVETVKVGNRVFTEYVLIRYSSTSNQEDDDRSTT